jgi:hypothetical protein
LKLPGDVLERVYRRVVSDGPVSAHEIAVRESLDLGVVADALIVLIGLKKVRPLQSDPSRFVAV